MSEQNCNCAGCGKPITGADYEDRYWYHEDGCPNDGNPDSADCDCNLEYQPDCAGDEDEELHYMLELQYVCIQRGKEIERLHSALEYWRSAFIALTIIVGVAIAVALGMVL